MWEQSPFHSFVSKDLNPADFLFSDYFFKKMKLKVQQYDIFFPDIFFLQAT